MVRYSQGFQPFPWHHDHHQVEFSHKLDCYQRILTMDKCNENEKNHYNATPLGYHVILYWFHQNQ